MPGVICGAKPRPLWSPANLPSLLVYDDATRTAVTSTGVTTESLTDLTAMAWVNPSDATGYNGTIIGRGEIGAEHWRMDQNDAYIRIAGATGDLANKSAVFAAGVWAHVCWRLEGGAATDTLRMRLYVGGVEVTKTAVYTIPAALTSRSGKAWSIGSLSTGSSYPFAAFGSIAQTIICGAALSDAEILAAYNYTNSRK